ncbi:MAG: hypothetical protein QXI60_03345 [Thermofilaceae archaeon]
MAYKILGMRKRVTVDQLGNIQHVYRIDIQTAKGIVTWVEVPVTASEQEIKQTLEAEARKLDALM